MTKKNNVKENAKTKTPLNSDSTVDQRTKRKTKNKLRLHSKLKVNVPLSQSLMLILPSLAKHVSASPQEHDVQDTPNDVIDSEEQHSQEDMNLLAEEHPKSDIIENTAPSDKAKVEDANSEQSQNSTLTPSHHLSSLSHPQVHYVPAVSIPTISSGQVPQPTTHTPVTPDLPVTTAVIAGTNTGSVTEESQLQTSGTLTVTDVDTGEAHFSNTDITAALGTLHLTDSGKWTYDLDNANPTVQALGKGSTATDTITVHSADGTPHQITITVNGTNDKAVIGGTSSGAVTEESQLHASGVLTVTDVDTGEAHFSNTDIAGALGTLHLTDTGGWTYDLDNTNPTVQALGQGSTATDTITVHSADHTPHQVTITINGTNDAAVIAGTNTGAVTEESQLQTSGTLTITDTDTGEAHFSNTDIVSSLGTLHLTDSGSWTYDLDNANPKVQALAQGSKATDTITVHSVDGTSHQVTITVNGTNDKAVIGGVNTGVVTEESQLHASGSLTITDVDTGEAHFSNTDIKGTLGTLHLTDAGQWTYDLDNKNPTVQALGKGATATDTITVNSVDGTSHQITITVNGTNDVAVIGGTNTGAVTEETQLQTSGSLTITDVDTGEAHFSNTDIVSSLGTLHLTDNGAWTYDLDNKNPTVQALAQGSTAIDTITVNSVDGTTHQITITVNGTNDAATVSSATVAIDETDTAISTSGVLTSTDVDNPDNAFTPDSITGTNGDLAIDATGHWTFTANSAFNQLNVGDKVTETFNVTSVDGTPSSIKVTINGTNDLPVISGSTSGAVIEAGVTGGVDNATGLLTATDPDTGDTLIWDVVQGQGTYGNLSIDQQGQWHYTLDNSNPTTDALGEGQQVSESFTITATDSSGNPVQQVVTIGVSGSNDNPVVSSSTQLAVGTEDKSIIINAKDLLTHATDVDHNDIGQISVANLTADHGSIISNPDGTFTFTPAKDYNGDVHFNYDVKDAHGGITHTGATTTLAAVGDAALIAGTDTGSVDEGHGHYFDMSPDYGKSKLTSEALYADGKLTIMDVDHGQNTFDTKGGGYNYQGQYGRVNLHEDGTWHYMVDIGRNGFTTNTSTTNVGTTIDRLGIGQSLTDTITVYSKDGTSHDIVVTIHGDNDRPYCSSEVQLNSGKEDQAKTITSTELLANTVDVDANDLGKLTIAALHADHGSIRDNNDGTFTFTPDKDYNGDVHFTYDVKDAHGGVTQTGAVTTLSSVNDNATITAHSYGGGLGDSGHEDVYEGQVSGNSGPASLANALRVSGVLYVHDSDAGESLLKADTHTTQIGGIFEVVPSSGEWKYHIDNSNPAVQQLGENESIKETLTVNSVDGTGHYDVEVVIHGTNDAPVLIAQTQSVTEDGAQLNGQMSATDIDSHDTLSYQIANAIDGLTFNGDGSYSFDPANSAYQHLANGHTQTLTIPVTVTDSSNASNTQNLVINITGSNDRPTVNNSHFGNSDEDKIHTFTATDFGFTDVDDGDTLHSVTISALPDPAKGHFSLNGVSIAMGQVVQASDIDKLAFEPSQDYNGGVQFGFMVNDGLRNSTPHIGRFTINPVRDGATITEFSTGSITEDGAHASTNQGITSEIATGKLDVVDPDPGESSFQFSQFGETAIHDPFNGHLRIDRSGSWQYTVDNAVLQHLAAGQTETVTYRIQSFDGTSYQLNIDVTGTNDAPVLSVTQNTSTTGILTETDVDVKDSHTFSVVNSTGQFGSLSVDTDSGAYVYTANGSVVGMSYNSATHTYHGTDVFEVKVADNHGGESSKFITFDANGHVSVVPGQQPTVSTTVPQNPLVTTALPSLPTGTNTPPSNTVSIDLAASTDTGTSDADNLTNNNTPTITGQADIPYSQVTIYDGSTPIGHAVSDGTGQYSAVVTTLTDGDHNLSANALAPSSIVPATSSLLPVHIDTAIAPLNVELAHDTGSSTSDLISSDGALTITGQEAGAVVEYSTDNGHTWTSSFAPQQGANTVSVRQTDPAGNVSSPTSLTFTYDDQIAAPAIDLNSSTDSGISATDDLTNVHTPIITGSAEANSSISITDENGKVVATGAANSSGVYQLTTSNIAEGSHTFTVTSTDVAGNQSSASLPIEVDYTAPTVSNVNLTSVTNHQPTFSGTVSLDTTSVDIVIESGGSVVETLHATLDGHGGYTVDATNLPDNHYVAFIQATDKAGNTTASSYAGAFDRFSVDTHASAPTISFESTGADNLYDAAEVAAGAANTITSTIHFPADVSPSDTLTINGQSHLITDAEYLAKFVNVEVTPGASISASITDRNGNTSIITNAIAPSADTNVAPLQVSLTHDTGSNSSDLITNDGSLTITGQEAGATVEYSTDNGHTWTSSFAPQQGANTVSVRQTDPAGNVSSPTSLTFTYDDQIAAPAIDLNSSTDSGISATDDLTNVHTPIITGSAEANSSISITDENGKVVATGAANSSGVYQLTTSNIAEGSHTFTVTSTDVAGNQSSASLPIEVDYTAPTVSNVNLTSVTNHQPTFSGTVSLDTTSVDIVIESGGSVVETLHATLDGHGGYTVDATNLPDNHYVAFIQATDKAGNTTASSYAGAFDRFSVDTHASAPTISFESTGADNLYNAAEVAAGAANTITSTIHFPADVSPSDTLTINGQSHLITDAEYLAKFVNVEVTPGASISASITDRNGNTSIITNAIAPSADTNVTSLQVSLTHDTGSNSSDLITNDGSLTITGQETGATIEYSVDGGHTWSNTFTPQKGTNTVEVRQTDTAGNISTSSSLTFTLDNTATAPSVSLTSDSGGSSSDKITNVGDLSVGGIEQGATVEYSIDNGVHWSTQFTPAEGQNNVQVRQTDIAGNVSPSTSLSYTLDTQIDIRVNSAQVDQHGQGMMVQVYFPKDSEITLIEITSDGGGTPLLVDLSTVRKFSTSSSVRNPDHQYQEFVGIDLSSLPDGNLSIRVAGTDTAGNTVSAQSSASSNYVLDTTASTSDDSNTAIEDSIIPVSGNLLSNDADAATVMTTRDIQGTYGTFHLSSDGSYTYTLNNQLSVIQQLDSASSPLVDSIAYTASDNHGNQATAHLAISIQGTDDNLPPTVTGQTVATNEDTTRTVTTSDFGYSDQDGDALQFVTISSIPSHGLLRLNGKAVTANQQITKADLDAGHLTFTPISNENGANYAQFTFTANDGHENSASATMILNVNAVNDAPIVGSSFISSLEDKPHAFTAADFKYSDIDGDALNHITITNVAHGVLTLNGATVNVGDDVSASDISSLIFTPTHNYFSSNTNGLGAVQFTANDGHLDSKEGSIFINIADVADPATFGGDSTGAAQEDTTLQASGTLTASDPDGTAGFIAVQGGVGIVGSKGYGHAHIDSNGHWTYDLYNKHPIVQQLGQGQTDTETITIQSADGTQHDIVITITGTNDLPTVSEKPQAGHITGQHSVDEDSNLTPAGQLIINDVDGDTTSVALDPTHSAAYGHVVFDAHSGTWVYHLDNSNPTVNALNDNDTLQDKFTLLVDDGHGQKVPQEITMTINGHTDPVPYTPPTISVTVDTRNAHHVTAGITPSTLQAYAHSIRGHATTVSGSHEIKGHGHSDIIIVSGRLHEEAELEGGNDILFLGGRLTDKEIEGGHGSDTLILGAYNRNNAPRLHDHGEKISDGREEMELESIENIILGDGTVLKGHLPANFPLVTHDHYEVPVNIQAHLSSGDESVSSIRLTHLQQGLTLQSNGHNINANHDGSYTVPANGHLVVVSDRPMNNGHHYFETEVTTHNSVTGVTAVTTEDLKGHIQSHVNPPPPPPPPVQHDEPDSPLTFEASVTIVDDSNTQNEQQHVGVTDSQHHDVSHHGAAAYLDALGIKPDATSTTVHDQPADMDIVLAQVDHPDATTHDQAHLDMSDALEHHDANVNHNQDDEHHHHNDVDGLPDIDPNH